MRWLNQAAFVFLTLLAQVAFAQSAQRPPNVVFILADDMGYGDVGAFNPESKIPTPRIDGLAREGIRFTDAHAAGAVCIPSRYGLLTGRYPFRNTRDFDKQCLIEPGRMTIASVLKQAGYATAMIGKWHQSFEGGPEFKSRRELPGGPVDHGFDSFFGIHASLDIAPYFYIENERELEPPTDTIPEHHSPGWSAIQGAFWRGGAIAPGFRHEEVLPLFTRKSVEYVQSRAGKEQPFFLYVALPAPHTPWVPTDAFKGKSGAGLYGDYVTEVDDAVGQILAAIEHAGTKDNTLVFFTSDNGPVWYEADVKRFGHRSAAGWRGMKGDVWEGGHRMPFIARWPGHIQAGASSAQTICFTDMLATFASITHQTLPDNAGEDSFDLLPALLGKTDRRIHDATLVVSSGGVVTIRQGDWKLIPRLGSGGFSKPARINPRPGDPAGQLYNLATDPAETTNVYLAHAEIVARMTQLLNQYTKAGRTRPAAR
jgi:arylsulfatase A-like enzyme